MTDENLQILIVDDNEMASELLSEFVELLGYRAKTTATGQEALAACQDVRPDVIITDIVLPDVDGYELAAKLRRLLGRDVRIFALSGLPRSGDRTEASAFDVWLEKPLDLAELERLLAQPRGAAK
ncbi:response regulator [Bordetella genomosp. 9]|uniref:Response regulatory domain-containing protein n=1 Tax=Bordetella genomosp. 9 TaxID=1416803 RepID=A0A1W6YXF2_9BORD|nr:response regulator [Bordetella genomosp. 9]ARP85671.1 hypothetical protein CAL13_05185 [Bordetella genomosp. 9]ARP89644.1 hypothetical protein CAL14_04535 [Bordetella genomosp. 9]